MATVVSTVSNFELGARVRVIIWTPLTSANTDGDIFNAPQFVDKSVQVNGTFGGATVVLQGSNVPTPGASDWQTLRAPDMTALSFTAADLKTVLDLPLHVRPFLTGGDGTTSINVYLLAGSSARK